jgi:hypothetical protein
LLNTNSRITAHKNYRKGLMLIRCYLSLYNTHHPAEKLGLPDKSPEPHAIIQPIIYHEKYEKNRNFSLVRIKELEYMS